jgi:uracil-DNA glycosylase family 4
MDATEKAAALAELAEQIASCPDCDLSRTRNRAVPGEGRPDAEIVLIGEGPGYYEDQQGRPFVGPAGHFLEQLLASIGLRRQDVYICNVIKCRPPENRDPLPQEISACRKWLDRQLEVIQPRLVVTLGRYSMNRYFPGQSIGRVRGQPRRVGDVVVVPFYHPAAALHQGSLRRTIEEDFKKLPAILKQALQEEPKEAAPEPEQMRLL